jgi:hypothetical protein
LVTGSRTLRALGANADDRHDDERQSGHADHDRGPVAGGHGRTVELGLPRHGLGELAEGR